MIIHIYIYTHQVWVSNHQMGCSDAQGARGDWYNANTLVHPCFGLEDGEYQKGKMHRTEKSLPAMCFLFWMSSHWTLSCFYWSVSVVFSCQNWVPIWFTWPNIDEPWWCQPSVVPKHSGIVANRHKTWSSTYWFKVRKSQNHSHHPQ